MSYNSRSPDRVGSKHRCPAVSDHFNNRPPSMRAGRLSSDDHPSDPRSYSPTKYDRRAYSPPRGLYNQERSIDRSDIGARQVKRTFSARDRSSSPVARNRRESREAARWDNTDRDRFVEKFDRKEAYRPIYPSANSSPAPSPSRSGLVTLNSKDSCDSSATSSPHPNQPNKSGSAISSTISSPHLNQPEKPKNPKATKALLSPRPSPRHPPPNNGKESTSGQKQSSDNIPVADQSSTNNPLESSTKAPMAGPGPQSAPKQSKNSTTMIVPPPGPQAETTDAVKDLGQLLYLLIEEATDLAALKMQKGAAERDFSKREKDFNISKPNHEKFPSIEISLRESKGQAKKLLREISQKCEKKDATLKSIALQGATHILSVARDSSTQVHDEKAQGRIDSLQKRCQDLEDQLREQRLFIEKQRSTREALEANLSEIQEEMAATKSRETDFRNFQDQLAATTNSYEQFRKEIRPFVDDAVQNASKCMSGLEVLKSDIKKDVSILHDKIPQNLELRLNDLTARSLDESKEDSASTTSAKAVADNTMIIADYALRLQKLEDQVRDNKGALSSHLKTIVETQSKFREVLETTQSSTAGLKARLKENITTVEERISTIAFRLNKFPSNAELVDFRKRISAVESELAKLAELRNEVKDSRKRLGVVEKHHHPNHTAAPVESLNGGEQLVGFEKRLSTLESVQSTATSTPAPEFDSESVKRDILAIVESREDAFDSIIGADIDKIKKAITRIDEDMKKQTITDAALPALSDLQTKLEELSQSVHNEQAYGRILQQIEIKYNKWATDQESSQQNLCERIENVEKGHQYFQAMDDRVEAAVMGIHQINVRLNGLNTREMANHILSQMDSTYPNLRDAQNTLIELKSSLHLAEARFLDMEKTINTLTGHIGRLQQNPAENPETAQALRKDLEDLNNHVRSSRQLAEDAKDAIDAASKKSADDAQILADQFADVYVQLRKLEDKQAAPSNVYPTNPALSVSSAQPLTVEARDRSFANGNSSIRRPAKFNSPELHKSPTSRQSSGEPLSRRSKKRHAMPWAPPLPPSKPNGVHSNPGRKKRKILIGGDDSDDIDFEPTEPTIDDDDEDD